MVKNSIKQIYMLFSFIVTELADVGKNAFAFIMENKKIVATILLEGLVVTLFFFALFGAYFILSFLG